jgi:tRNA U55 pseudouridine synthase TruB
MVSAVKVGGKRLYRLARRGKTVERSARPIEIREFELVRFEPPHAEVHIVCSKGTYVRTLAADIGEELGCGAYLDRLTRVRIGPYRVEDSIRMEELEDPSRVKPLEAVLPIEETIEKLPRRAPRDARKVSSAPSPLARSPRADRSASDRGPVPPDPGSGREAPGVVEVEGTRSAAEGPPPGPPAR